MTTLRTARASALMGALVLGLAASGAVGAQSYGSAGMESRSSAGTAGQSTAQTPTGQVDRSIAQAKASDLIGKEIVNADGTKIGKVSEVARHQPDNSLQLVVKTSGHLGLGEKHMAVPLNQIRMEGRDLQLTQEISQEQMRQDVASYDKKSFQPISRQQRKETIAALEKATKAG